MQRSEGENKGVGEKSGIERNGKRDHLWLVGENLDVKISVTRQHWVGMMLGGSRGLPESLAAFDSLILPISLRS